MQRILLFSFILLFAWSGITPLDRFTWYLEVFPAAIGLVIVLSTARRFPLSRLAYLLLWIHGAILLVGGHYTYAEVPLFQWLAEIMGSARNNYDRLGHFAQGFIPAILAREILIRRSPVKEGRWLFFLVTCICLSISALYELIEMAVSLTVSVTSGGNVDAFLGTQGDIWDTQWDMTCALVGAILAQLFLAGIHDRSIAPRVRSYPDLPMPSRDEMF